MRLGGQLGYRDERASVCALLVGGGGMAVSCVGASISHAGTAGPTAEERHERPDSTQREAPRGTIYEVTSVGQRDNLGLPH